MDKKKLAFIDEEVVDLSVKKAKKKDKEIKSCWGGDKKKYEKGKWNAWRDKRIPHGLKRKDSEGQIFAKRNQRGKKRWLIIK